MITKEEYLDAKKIVDEYESNIIDEQFRFYKIGANTVERIIHSDNIKTHFDLKKELEDASYLINKKYIRKFYTHMSTLFLNNVLNNNDIDANTRDKAIMCRNIIYDIINPPKPEMPLSRVIKDGYSNFCSDCGSTESKNGFLGLFGKVVCHNKECIKSK